MGKASRGEIVPITFADPKKLRCCDCGGFPLDSGSIFVSVFLIRDGKAEIGGICELCLLKRLERRSQLVNASSSRDFQVHVPEIGINRTR